MTDPQSLRNQAEALYQTGEWMEALAAFDQWIQHHGPGDGNLLHDRAVCVFQLGRQREALQELDKAVALEPDNPYRYSSRAWMRAALKDVDGAMEDYRQALVLDPDDAIALNNLGLLEEQYGMRKAAQEKFRRADTLMGILRDAGVDPSSENGLSGDPSDAPPASSSTVQQPASTESNRPEKDAQNGSVIREMIAVFTAPGRGKEFLTFLKKGLRS